MTEKRAMVVKEDPQVTVETVVARRLTVLEGLRREFPMMGGFSPEQMVRPEMDSIGDRLLPPGHIGADDDRIYGLANIRRKDISKVMRVWVKGEKQAGRDISINRFLKVWLWLTRSVGAKGSEDFIRLGPAGLQPQPKPGRLKRWLGRA